MDAWDEGSKYDEYMGRWSGPVAGEFLAWLGVPPGARWLDVGCGTGALSRTILDLSTPRSVSAVDPSPGFVAAARSGLGSDADLHVGDAQDLPFEADEFDAAVSGLALNFVPDPAAAVLELSRVTRPGGVVAAYVWDYRAGMQMIRSFWDAAISLDPSIAHLDEATRFPLCDPDRLAELFEDSGVADVEVTGLTIPTRFETFDDLWRPMLGGQGPAPSYVTSLPRTERERLRSTLQQTLAREDGPLDLTARAWAVKAIA